ncbi:MAG TPA: PIN domain-containing protein, partial [Burkholderiales bacterium]|nr:PIN domain-containing protein [Burkholderiales bacterium]
DRRELGKQGFRLIPIHARHVEASRRLSTSHADPFDRLLLATAQVEHLIVLTCDEALIALRQQDHTLPLSTP